MKYVNSMYIRNFFDELNSSKVDYVLIKNVNKELPDKLIAGKDIDLLVHANSKSTFQHFINKKGRKFIHPYGKESGWINIYGLPDFEYWRLNTADDLFIDVSYMLSCHSLMPKIWLPLDNHIQVDIWKNRVFDSNNNWWRIDDNILYVYLVTRCILDKGVFPDVYKTEIIKQSDYINEEIVVNYFKFIFFKFTMKLMDLLKNKKFDYIIHEYLRFKAY